MIQAKNSRYVAIAIQKHCKKVFPNEMYAIICEHVTHAQQETFENFKNDYDR
jgi:hypothetical protein